MILLFLQSLARLASLLVLALLSLFDSRLRVRGRLLVLIVTPLFVAVQLVTWLFVLIDEIFFAAYRRVDVRSPLFVIGPPRTGTTFLHHVLAEDERTTTFKLWECLFGVTITGKRIVQGIVAIDRVTGHRIGRALGAAGRRLFSAMDDVHPLALDTPEEDFLLLLPTATCFLLVVPYPRAGWLYRYARFDRALSGQERKRHLDWYRRCIQKHLYVYGADKQFLSKNASFAGWSDSLLDAFPDARLLCTWRDPVEAVPSQLSSLRPAFETFGYRGMDHAFKERLVRLTEFYYRHLDAVRRASPDRTALITTEALRADLPGTVRDAMRQVGLEVSESLDAALEARAARSREHQSAHRYTLAEFGLSSKLIESRFRGTGPDA